MSKPPSVPNKGQIAMLESKIHEKIDAILSGTLTSLEIARANKPACFATHDDPDSKVHYSIDIADPANKVIYTIDYLNKTWTHKRPGVTLFPIYPVFELSMRPSYGEVSRRSFLKTLSSTWRLTLDDNIYGHIPILEREDKPEVLKRWARYMSLSISVKSLEVMAFIALKVRDLLVETISREKGSNT